MSNKRVVKVDSFKGLDIYVEDKVAANIATTKKVESEGVSRRTAPTVNRMNLGKENDVK